MHKILIVVVASIVFGCASAASDILTTIFFSTDLPVYIQLPEMLLNSYTLWIAVALYASGTESKILRMMLFSFLSMSIMVMSYYTFGVIFGNRGDVPLSTIEYEIMKWSLVAVAGSIVATAIAKLAHLNKYFMLLWPLIALTEIYVIRGGFDLYSKGVDVSVQLGSILLLVISLTASTLWIIVRPRTTHN